MRRWILLVALVCAACADDSPTAPTPVRIPPCQSNSTAYVRFGNRSASTTHSIYWDGLNYFTLGPGQDSAELLVAAGVAHSLQFRISNTTSLACVTTNPVPIVCGAPIYTCAFP